ncbi:penicillin-binding protein [Fusobacterium polymorphum]|uniref:penicillin-binding protein n=1 Tax=Fusobacterium nucleatum subsp. polymorphum TaxID=76857 RepID=UPI0030097BEE
MKTINFYKKDKLIFSVYAESLEDVLKSPLSYFSGYTQDMIITDISYQYPFYKDDVLREMTREEKVRAGIDVTLEDGEIIKDKKIITVPKPSGNPKYLSWNKEKGLWLLDNEREYQDYMALIDDLKAKSLAYGFDYKVDGKEHRQKCRDKDITLLASNVTFMLAEKTISGKEKPITWYFEDNFGLELNLEKSLILASYGKTFTQSVYDTEHYFKTKVNPKELTKAEFESKRKEVHSKLATS